MLPASLSSWSDTFHIGLPRYDCSFFPINLFGGGLGTSQILHFGGKTGGKVKIMFQDTDRLKEIVQCNMPWLGLDFIQRHRVAVES